MEKSHLFIGGVPRSGTTAFAELLCRHPQMIVTTERFFNLADPNRLAELTPGLFDAEHYLNPSDAETHNWQWGQGSEYQSWLQDKYDQALVVGDKVPDYFRFADRILGQFPRAKFIFLLRNVYDVAGSYNARRLDKSDTVWSAGVDKAVVDWNWANRYALDSFTSLHDRLIVVSYEQLFCHDPSYMSRILSFLDVAADDERFASAYRDMTADWQWRFAKPRALDVSDYQYIREHADVAASRSLVDLLGV